MHLSCLVWHSFCICVCTCAVFEHTVPILLGMRELGRVNSNLSLACWECSCGVWPLEKCTLATPSWQKHCQGRRGQWHGNNSFYFGVLFCLCLCVCLTQLTFCLATYAQSWLWSGFHVFLCVFADGKSLTGAVLWVYQAGQKVFSLQVGKNLPGILLVCFLSLLILDNPLVYSVFTLCNLSSPSPPCRLILYLPISLWLCLRCGVTRTGYVSVM